MSKATASMPDAATIDARSDAFAAQAERVGPVTLLAVGDALGVRSFVVTPAVADAEPLAFQFAQTVGAHSTRVPDDELPDFSGVRVVGELRFNARAAVVRETQVGADPSELPRTVAHALQTYNANDDDAPTFVAVTFRAASNRERRRATAWFQHRLGTGAPTHYSQSRSTVVASVIAGGDSADEVRRVLSTVAAAVRGFDLGTRVVTGRPLVPMSASGVIAAAGAAPAVLVDAPIADAGWFVAGVGAAGVAGFASGVLRTRVMRVSRAARRGVFVKPPKRASRVRAPGVKTVTRDDGTVVSKADAGEYPLRRNAFLLAPHMFAGVAAPHAGASSGVQQVVSSQVPPALIDPSIGPVVGVSANGQRVHVPASQLFGGVLAIGRMGSGKSQWLRWLFANLCVDRRASAPLADGPSNATGIVVFERKGEDARVWERWSQLAEVDPSRPSNDCALVMDMWDANGFAIDMTDVPGSLDDRARFIAQMLKYGFDDGAIQGESLETLRVCVSGGLAVSSDMLAGTSIEPGRSWVFYTHVLLGGMGDAVAVELAAAIARAAVDARNAGAPNADLEFAMGVLLMLFDPKVTPAQRRNKQSAPRNKVDQLLAADAWFDPQRQRVSWTRILEQHRVVVINAGASSTDTAPSHSGAVAMMSAMLAYGLKHAIERTCSGWQKERRAIAIVCDELSLLAGDSPDVIEWFHDQGRSLGVIPIFASQRVGQLQNRLVDSVMDYSNRLWLETEDPTAAALAASALSLRDAAVTAADVAGLAKFTAYLQTTLGSQKQAPVVIELWNAEGSMVESMSALRVQRGMAALDASGAAVGVVDVALPSGGGFSSSGAHVQQETSAAPTFDGLSGLDLPGDVLR